MELENSFLIEYVTCTSIFFFVKIEYVTLTLFLTLVASLRPSATLTFIAAASIAVSDTLMSNLIWKTWLLLDRMEVLQERHQTEQ